MPPVVQSPQFLVSQCGPAVGVLPVEEELNEDDPRKQIVSHVGRQGFVRTSRAYQLRSDRPQILQELPVRPALITEPLRVGLDEVPRHESQPVK